jgi:hypothetical protein
MGLFGFGDDTYSKDYLMKLGRKYGINAEAGHLKEKGINVMSNGDGTYTTDASVNHQELEREKNKLTRSVNKHLK